MFRRENAIIKMPIADKVICYTEAISSKYLSQLNFWVASNKLKLLIQELGLYH